MKKRKHYLAPKVSVVSFVVESGFTTSLTVLTTQEADIFGENLNGQYQEASDWSNSFGTGGTGTSYF